MFRKLFRKLVGLSLDIVPQIKPEETITEKYFDDHLKVLWDH